MTDARPTPVRWPRYAAAAVGLAWFVQIGGGPALDPRYFGWLMAGDWLQHWLGWLFFADEPWRFPLGRIDSLLYPVGTNIGFTDSNPLVSLLLKPFAGLLPRFVQFIGPWLALCFALQGYVGAALAGTVTKRPSQQFLGGCLFALSPVLVARLGHDTLCAHWLLLGLLYLGLRECPDERSAHRSSWLATLTATVAASIHPYLAVMCWVLAQAVFARFWWGQRLTLFRAARHGLATTLAILAVFAAIGYFGDSQLSTRGFGHYTSNGLTLVNPMGYSRLLPSVDVPVPQWEGFGFLGSGGLALALVAVAVFIRRWPAAWKRVWPVLAVSVLMAIYALSTVVSVGNRELLRLDWLTPFVTPFRASGRFVWPFHYVLLLFGVWGMTRLFPSKRHGLATAMLAGAVALQAFDLKVDPAWAGPKPFPPAPFYNLRLAAGRFRHVALYPMQVYNVCGGDYDEAHGYSYMYLAYRLHSTYNGGIFARVPERRVRAECWALIHRVARGDLDPETLYVLSSDALPAFQRVGAACGQFGDDWICVSPASDRAFRQYLLQNVRREPAQ